MRESPTIFLKSSFDYVVILGRELAADLKAELRREWARSQLGNEQVQALEALHRERVAAASGKALALVAQLMQLRGVGWQSAWS